MEKKEEGYEENAGYYDESVNTNSEYTVKKNDRYEEKNVNNNTIPSDKDRNGLKEEPTSDSHFVEDKEKSLTMDQEECSMNSKEKTLKTEVKPAITPPAVVIKRKFGDNSKKIYIPLFSDSNDSSSDDESLYRNQNLRGINAKMKKLKLQELEEREKMNAKEIKSDESFSYLKDSSSEENINSPSKKRPLTFNHFEKNNESYPNYVDKQIYLESLSELSIDNIRIKHDNIKNGNTESGEKESEKEEKGNEESEEEETEEEETEEEETEEEEPAEQKMFETATEIDSESETESETETESEDLDDEEEEYDPDDFSCNLTTAIPLTDDEPYVFDISSLLAINIYNPSNETLVDLRRENAKNQRKIRKLTEVTNENESELFNQLFSDKSNEIMRNPVSQYKFLNISHSPFYLDILFLQNISKKSIDGTKSEVTSFGQRNELNEANKYHIYKNSTFKLYKEPEEFIRNEENSKILPLHYLSKSYNEHLITNPMVFLRSQELGVPFLLSGFKDEDSYTYDSSSMLYLFSLFVSLYILGIFIFISGIKIKSNFL